MKSIVVRNLGIVVVIGSFLLLGCTGDLDRRVAAVEEGLKAVPNSQAIQRFAKEMGERLTSLEQRLGRVEATQTDTGAVEGLRQELESLKGTVAAQSRDIQTALQNDSDLKKRLDEADKRIKNIDAIARKALKAAREDDAPTPAPTAGRVAGPGAPAPKAAPTGRLANDNPVTLWRPSVAEIQQAVEVQGRDVRKIRIYYVYNPDDAKRKAHEQAVWQELSQAAKAAKLDLAVNVPEAHYADRSGYQIEFGPVSDAYKAARVAPAVK